MKKSFLHFFILLFFAIQALSLSAQSEKWLEKATKLENEYQNGRYKFAKGVAKRLEKRQIKRQEDLQMLPITQALRAKQLDAMGKAIVARDLLENADQLWTKQSLNDSSAFWGNYFMALTWFDFGFTYKAKAYVDKAYLNLVELQDVDGNLYQNLRFVELKINKAQMNFEQARVVLDTAIKFQTEISNRIVLVYDSSIHQLVPTKLKRKEFKKRYADLVWLRVQEAEIELMYGNLTVADSLYVRNQDEYMFAVGKSYQAYYEHHVGYAELLRQLGEYRKSANHFKKARNFYKERGRFVSPNKFYNTMFEKEMWNTLEWNRTSRYTKQSNQYQRELIRNFGRKSYHFNVAKRLEKENKINKGKFKSVSKAVNNNYKSLCKRVPTDHYIKRDFLEQLFFINTKLNDFQSASMFVEEIAELEKQLHGENAPVYKKALLDKASYELHYTFDFFEADSLYRNNFDSVMQNMHPLHADYLNYLNDYSKLNQELDRFDKALELYTHAVEVSLLKYGNRSLIYGRQLSKQADIMIVKGQYEDAEKVLRVAEQAIKDDKAKQSIAYFNTLQTLAQLQNINGKYDEAQETIRKSLRVAKKLGVDAGMVNASNSEDLAEIFIKTGRYDEAEKMLKQSIDLKSKKFGESNYQLISPYSLLGTLYLVKGDFVNAEKSIQQSLLITQQNVSDTSSKYIENLVLLGDVYANMGDYEKAITLYNEAIVKSEKIYGKYHISISEILIKIVNAKLSTDYDVQEVFGILDTAIHTCIIAVGDEHPMFADAIELKALVHTKNKQFDEALDLLGKSKVIYERTYGKKNVKTIQNKSRVANVYYFKQDYGLAIKNYNIALKGFKSIFNKVHPNYTSTLSQLGRVYYTSGDYKKATKVFDQTTAIYLNYLKTYFPALSENEKAKYWNKIRADFEIFNSLVLNYSDKNPKLIAKMYNNQLATKAILLNSSVKVREQIMNQGDEYLISLYDMWLNSREKLTAALSMSLEEQRAAGLSVKVIEKDINNLEKEMSLFTDAFNTNTRKSLATWKDVRKSLKSESAAIEIIRFQYFTDRFTDSVLYAALIVKAETKKHPELVLFAEGNKLETRYLKYYRNSMRLRTRDKYSYAQFWEPIAPKLNGIKKIYFSGDGVYNQLNPETFMVNDSSYLLDYYTFYTISNTRDLLEPKESNNFIVSNKVVLFGNPQFGDESDTENQENATGERSLNNITSVEPLPGAEEEVRLLSALLKKNNWQTETYLLKEATETQVKRVTSPRVVHIATHGFFIDEQQTLENDISRGENHQNPLLKSGLLFVGAEELLSENNIYQFNRAEGILTAFEAMNLKLDHTELVVLSACETGLGEVHAGEGVFGLQRSFIVAGAQNIIMTLFKVNDQVTQELMQEFYSVWIETGDKRSAFQKAKQNIRNKYESPIFWGSFVLIGLD